MTGQDAARLWTKTGELPAGRSTVVCGIDPGIRGAIALFSVKTGECVVHDMPVLALVRNGRNKHEVDAHALASLFWKEHVGHAFVEQAWCRPNDSGPGALAVGVGYGKILGVLAAVGVPLTIVSPQKWKRALGVPGEKDGARARASQLLPQAAEQWPLKKHDGRAEAALLCLYGHRTFSNIAVGEAA